MASENSTENIESGHHHHHHHSGEHSHHHHRGDSEHHHRHHGEGEHHRHHHHHHHHHHSFSGSSDSLKAIFYWAIGLNMAYVVIEAIFGFINGSMGLLSDAGHNLSDVASLLIALIAFKASRRPATPNFSYGFGKATVEASLVNAVILYVAVIFILIESIDRLIHPASVDGFEIAWVAGAGVIVNGITAWMLMRHSRNDINVKGAFLHMLSDTLVSVGVVASGIIIHFTAWSWLDPIVGILIALMIAFGSWSLLKEALSLALDGVPGSVNIQKVKSAISSVPEVESFHHLHIWAMSTTNNALTVHVIVASPEKIDPAIAGVRKALEKVGINHSTIEAETKEHDCGHSGLDK